MADFYHDSLMHNLSHHIYQQQQQDPSIIDPTTTATAAIMLNDERECFNVTELEAVPNRLGQWFLISLYSLTSLLALIGNLTVIIVELYGKESAHNIRKYLINLAVSDITIGVLCVPFTYTDFMLGQWIFPHWLCPTAQFVQLLSVFVTSLTLTFIGIERYMATLHPFSSLHHWLECHTHIMLALTWVFGSAYAYIPFENTATRPFMLPSDNQTTYYECTYDNGVSVLKLRLFMTSNIVLTFILPLTVLIFSYSAIMRKLIADEKRFRKSSNHAYGVKFKSTICKSISNNNPANNPKRKSLSDNNSPSISNNNNSDQQQQSSLSLTPTKPCHHLANNHHHHHNSVLNEQNNCKCRCCCSCCSKQKLSKTLSSPISTSTTSTTTTTTAMNIATTTTIINSSEMDIIRPSSILSDINDDDGDGVNSLTSSCDSCNHHHHHHHGNHQQHQQQQKKKRQTIKSGPCCLSTKTFQKSKMINNNQNNNNNVVVGYPNGRLRLSAEELSIKRITNSSVQQQSIATTTTTTITPTTTTATLNQLSTSTSQIDLRKSTPFNYRSKTIKMMFTVILLYGICWMPIKLYQFLNDYGLIAYCTERELYAMICLYFICHWMAMANSFVNPIIYSFMSKSFRNDFSKITKTFRQTFSKNFNQHSIKTSSTQV